MEPMAHLWSVFLGINWVYSMVCVCVVPIVLRYFMRIVVAGSGWDPPNYIWVVKGKSQALTITDTVTSLRGSWSPMIQTQACTCTVMYSTILFANILWLVVTILKNDGVHGKDDIPCMKWKIKVMFQTTNQYRTFGEPGWGWTRMNEHQKSPPATWATSA